MTDKFQFAIPLIDEFEINSVLEELQRSHVLDDRISTFCLLQAVIFLHRKVLDLEARLNTIPDSDYGFDR